MKIAGKWVPAEPTAAMMAKGFIADEGCDDPAEVYRLMLAAAPQLDIEAMVEEVAKVLLDAEVESALEWSKTSDRYKDALRYRARAVLRHLFGGSA